MIVVLKQWFFRVPLEGATLLRSLQVYINSLRVYVVISLVVISTPDGKGRQSNDFLALSYHMKSSAGDLTGQKYWDGNVHLCSKRRFETYDSRTRNNLMRCDYNSIWYGMAQLQGVECNEVLISIHMNEFVTTVNVAFIGVIHLSNKRRFDRHLKNLFSGTICLIRLTSLKSKPIFSF